MLRGAEEKNTKKTALGRFKKTGCEGPVVSATVAAAPTEAPAEPASDRGDASSGWAGALSTGLGHAPADPDRAVDEGRPRHYSRPTTPLFTGLGCAPADPDGAVDEAKLAEIMDVTGADGATARAALAAAYGGADRAVNYILDPSTMPRRPPRVQALPHTLVLTS